MIRYSGRHKKPMQAQLAILARHLGVESPFLVYNGPLKESDKRSLFVQLRQTGA